MQLLELNFLCVILTATKCSIHFIEILSNQFCVSLGNRRSYALLGMRVNQWVAINLCCCKIKSYNKLDLCEIATTMDKWTCTQIKSYTYANEFLSAERMTTYRRNVKNYSFTSRPSSVIIISWCRSCSAWVWTMEMIRYRVDVCIVFIFPQLNCDNSSSTPMKLFD